MATTKTTRRVFLQVLGAAAAVPVLGGCMNGGGADPAPVGTVSAGNVADLPVGSLVAVTGHPVCIGHDDGGIYAMTLTCTHAGCDMSRQGSVSASGITCNCHGSTFDANGEVTGGPAHSALQHFMVSADADGNLTIHGDSDADASFRLQA